VATKRKAGPKPGETLPPKADDPTRVDAKALGEAIAVCRLATSTRLTPIYACVLISSTPNGLLQITGSMLTTRISTRIQRAGGVVFGGAVAVDAARLASLVASLDGDIQLSITDTSRLRVASKSGSEFLLQTLPSQDFPREPDEAPVHVLDDNYVDGTALAGLINDSIYAASKDTGRLQLNAIELRSVGDSLHAACTDGNRLVVLRRVVGGEWPASTVLSRGSALAVARLASGRVTASVSGSWMEMITGSGTTITTRLLDVMPPPIDRVVPATQPGAMKNCISVRRGDLIGALRQALIFAPERTPSIQLSAGPGGSLQIQATNVDHGAAKVLIPADVSFDCEPVALNAGYLIEALAHLSDDVVVLGYDGKVDPVAIRTSDAVVVIMPISL